MSCVRKSSDSAGRSLRKTLGKVWDFFRKRGRAKMQAEQPLRFGPYCFDPLTGQLWRGKQAVKVTPKAAAVLGRLVAWAGQVVSKEELFRTVWPDTVVSDAALSSCIQELRRV